MKTLNRNKGFTLLMAIVTTSLLLVVSFMVVNIAFKQLVISSINTESQYAFYNADSGVECATYWDLHDPINSQFSTTSAGSISCAGVSISSGGQTVPTIPSQLSVIGGGGGVETIWLDDSTSAALSGASQQSDGGDSWSWVSGSPSPSSGTESHQSSINSGEHQHYFYSSGNPLSVSTGDTLFAYVYLDPANPPTEIMLQWNNGAWEHRAYWGADNIPWGAPGPARYYMGALPATGSWVRLSVPASYVSLEGSTINGMAFTIFDGRATWDKAGKTTGGVSGGSSIFKIEYPKGCAIVTVTKSYVGSALTTTVDSRGYNTCDTTSPKRYERGVTITY
jgi:hypothetical protein